MFVERFMLLYLHPQANRMIHVFFFIIFTSMFVERMEVLEYRKKFEVELSTFPDSTNTKTPRKLVFSLTCVCLSVCLCCLLYTSPSPRD